MSESATRLSPTARTEAFSDGVMAIAITLLVLEVHVPTADDVRLRGSLLEALLHGWPKYVAYLAAFLVIGIIWLNHHAAFAKIKQVDRTLAWCNLGLLLTVSFLPFPTAVMGEYVTSGGWNARVATAFFAVLAAAMGWSWLLLWRHLMRHPELFEPPYDSAFARLERNRSALGVATYLSCTGIALVVPMLALVLLVAVAAFYAATSQVRRSSQ